ncbi:sodium-dependent transporter [Pseudodesulfovibrio sp. zrk46]|uniref:sodium-dependent transporter n=1 Tax=Pseudodesulfovibrio sp. zrk46 TaxID=2725288 RepID=UPI00144985A2|nr:sodium-dependent transporter [Pseudodesulfovibrio sp. zrk46]QJB55373.1 sodium-dependent transporter [Pseudodesulfovibrio sp. zrk46]
MAQREQWGSRVGFVLAAVGSAIGLGNIWRFPYMAYENGGGAFLIPYIFALLTAGIPFMIMEFGLGHKFRGSAPKVFRSLGSKWEFLGWMQVLVAFVISVYYVAVIGWTINYTGFALNQAWGADPKGFFFGEYLGLTGSPMELGGIRWSILGACTLAWGVTWLAITSGVRKGIERACKVLIPLLFVLVLVLIFRVVSLPGAMTGLDFLFKPDFSKLADFSVWADAYGQIFFSLSIGFAIMLAYSSYLPKEADINNNAAMTVFINCGFSMLAGVMIFAVLGHMAHETNQAVSDVAGAGVGLAFITIPTAINTMPAPVFFGTLFFLCLTMAGVSSHISIVEAVSSSFIDKFGIDRKKTASIVCGLGFALTVIFTTGGGLLILDIVDHFINNLCILSLALAEIILMSYVVGLEDIRSHANATSDFTVGNLWNICLKVVTVGVLGYTFIMNVITDSGTPYGGYANADLIALGWSLLPVAFILSLVLKQKQAAPGFSNNR